MEGLQARLRRDLEHARWLAAAVDAAPGWERLAPGDLAGFEQMMAYAGEMRALGAFGLGDRPHTGPRTFARALPLLFR